MSEDQRAAVDRTGDEGILPLRAPYLVYLGDVRSPINLKTAMGLKDWAPDKCIGQHRVEAVALGVGLPDMGFEEAARAGAQSLVIGMAIEGGQISPLWYRDLVAALDAGLDIVSGMHSRLGEVPEIAAAARRSGRRLVDVRHLRPPDRVATGEKRAGSRLLTVGTDCALGKKYTALAIARGMEERGIACSFRATGQTGIMIAGSGYAIDSVVSDFVAGAAEQLSPPNGEDHWDVIEGQGSLFHPAYAAVSLGLLHGSQPDAIVMCHDPGRAHIESYPGFPIPDLKDAIARNLELARLTNGDVECVGISVNTRDYDADGRWRLLRTLEIEHGLACFDPVATGVDRVIDAIAGER